MKKAVVVEDSRTMQAILTPILEEAGYRVQVSPGCDETLEVVEGDEAIDLVVIEGHFLEVDGVPFVKKVKARGTRLIVLAGDYLMEVARLAMRAGADAVVVKPFQKGS